MAINPETGERDNLTNADAYERVTQASIGSFVNASDDFLIALRDHLYKWIARIDHELHSRVMAAAKRQEAELEEMEDEEEEEE